MEQPVLLVLTQCLLVSCPVGCFLETITRNGLGEVGRCCLVPPRFSEVLGERTEGPWVHMLLFLATKQMA